MNILLTGATGYIGKRLLPVLVGEGHHVYCCVRDARRFNPPENVLSHISVIEVDFLDPETPAEIPPAIDVAYYLIHSMSASENYDALEQIAATHFCRALEQTEVRQVIYLTGISNANTLSRHLISRKRVEEVLSGGRFSLTALRAGIIVGSGSASFEIMRDLVEKLPVMIAPKWLHTRCQPIAIRDVIAFLSGCILKPETYNQHFDIGGPDILSYKQMLLELARVRQLKRWIITVPVMTPRLSSYWLYFVTSTSYKLATALVNSMRVEVVCADNRLCELLNVKPMGYRDSLIRTFARIEQHNIPSSWKDSMVSGRLRGSISDWIQVPQYGCFKDARTMPTDDEEAAIRRIWSLGGDNGWYYASFLWKIRGVLDLMAGGVGLRRGRTHPINIQTGDALDFWRVLYANQAERRLLLYAEMKLPGEAWLEFRVEEGFVKQTATFRPRGVLGRLYWYSVWPFHGWIFKGMLRRLAGG